MEIGKVLRYVLTLRLVELSYAGTSKWGKSQTITDFKNKLEFWDRLKQKHDWENEDLDWATVRLRRN